MLQGLPETHLTHLKALDRRSQIDEAGIFKGHFTRAWPKLADPPTDDVLNTQRRLTDWGTRQTANKPRS